MLTDIPTSVYGEFLRQQVEDRLKFYETGDAPKKNIDVMHEAMQEVSQTETYCREDLTIRPNLMAHQTNDWLTVKNQ